jgi:hypothetical protein
MTHPSILASESQAHRRDLLTDAADARCARAARGQRTLRERILRRLS